MPAPNELFGPDAYAPSVIARRIETVGVSKTRLLTLSRFILGMLGCTLLAGLRYHVIYDHTPRG